MKKQQDSYENNLLILKHSLIIRVFLDLVDQVLLAEMAAFAHITLTPESQLARDLLADAFPSTGLDGHPQVLILYRSRFFKLDAFLHIPVQGIDLNLLYLPEVFQPQQAGN